VDEVSIVTSSSFTTRRTPGVLLRAAACASVSRAAKPLNAKRYA
jgi:hypothetical protein